ncbi:shikimate dehydrogenase [Jeotgalibacillus sp. R-1-5s-1]|uniref:shikimate dehydrogenase n=1 Tax=Jeotgalibacillus sp. R-1-5s-1 TaxID=2555897 RepID=UPI00141AC045|nr:shikimate dehydrogenase [Jeotgalibacillus sp. R-1-5s-1]
MKLAVIGHPIKQSKSPFMHTIWLGELGISGSYEAKDILPEALAGEVKALVKGGYDGWNVTIPHKEAIIPLLDEVDEQAAVLGAVNTVIVKDGRLIGKNTDGTGFMKSLLLKRTAVDIAGSRVCIIGAGGAAKGIAGALVPYQPKSLSIANRTVSKGERLLNSLIINGEKSALTMDEAEAQLDEFDIVINTTSVGMVPDTDQTPINMTRVKKNSLAADIIYNPLQTAFLKQASEGGADTLNGVGMFVYQGATAFEEWTGEKPDAEKMIKRISESIGGT